MLISTNSFFNPTNGHINKIDFTISPKDISDSSFYKFVITNKNYKKLLRYGAKYIAISSFIWDNPKLEPELAIRMFK